MQLNGHRQRRAVMVGRADTLAQPSPATVTLDKETRLSGTTTDSHQTPVPQNNQGDRYG